MKLEIARYRKFILFFALLSGVILLLIYRALVPKKYYRFTSLQR